MLLDIGAGIFAAITLSHALALPLTPQFVIGAILFSLLMDIDFLLHFLRGGNTGNSHRHRDILHHPLIYVPLGAAILYLAAGGVWALLFCIASLAHFLHDSIGIGWGVQWLWPFSQDHFAFFYHSRPRHKERMPKKIIYVWKHKDIDRLADKYGDKDWVKSIYLHWHPYAVIELLFFAAALFLLFTYAK